MVSPLSIPLDILQHRLPSQNLSISDFLSFKLLNFTRTFINNESYLSKESPDASDNDIKSLLLTPAPSLSLMQDLIDCLASISPATAASVACQEVQSAQVKHFPLWFITYWREISQVLDVHHAWSQANRSLQELLHGPGAGLKGLIEKVDNALSKMPGTPWSSAR
jgi:hypothetical protein